jgi:hypothetical protein
MYNTATMRHCQQIAGFPEKVRRRAKTVDLHGASAEPLSSTVRAAKFAMPVHGMVEIGLIEKYGPVR